jgi:hypothetical protein
MSRFLILHFEMRDIAMAKNNKLNGVKRKFKKLAIIFLFLLFLATAIFWLYAQVKTYPAETESLEAILEHEKVKISEESNHFYLLPETIDHSILPIIFYPGGLVAPEAYLYKMGRVAICLQTTVYIVKSPFNAPIFSVNTAGKIIKKYNLDRVWVGGHSLGGISACRFTSGNPEKVFGLFLFGSYCDRDISEFSGKVISIMGLKDQIINRENYQKAKSNLPLNVNHLEIIGLNHSDFGDYGQQSGDGASSLDNEQIIEIICRVFLENT